MHKRKLSLILTLMVSTSLFSAEVWESNALSMRLEPLDDVPESGYYLLFDDGEESLYLDGNLISRKSLTSNGFTLTRGQENTIYTLDECGRPLSIEEGSSVTRNVYSKEGRLLSSTITDSEGLETISEYHWSPEGNLMYVEEVLVRYYLPSTSFHYAIGDSTFSLNAETPDVFIEKLGEEKSKVEVQDDESVKLLSPGGGERVYSKDGFLIHEVKGSSTFDYVYSDGMLTESIEVDGNSEIRLYYEDGSLSGREYLVDGSLTRRQVFEMDGYLTEDRYRNGKAYARVHYDKDHKTIRSIESL